jgi:hypothetical protein
MITIGVPRRTADLVQRWLPTGREDAYPAARSRDPNKPATAPINDARKHQAELPPPVRQVDNRIERRSAPALASSASAKSP